MPLLNELQWYTMTQTVNAIKKPNQFLTRLLFSTVVPVATSAIEMSIISRGREIAPFVKKGAEAVMVGGHTEKFSTVEAPNIRIKKPFNISQLMEARRAGTGIHIPGTETQISAIEAHVARDLAGMNDMIINAEEWLVSQALQGTITFEEEDGDVFTITYPKPAANVITLSTFWNDATPANVRVLKNIETAKAVAAEEGFTLTDAIMGSEADAQLMELAEAGNLKFLNTNTGNGITAGTLSFVENFSTDGAIYRGELGGIRFWSYPRTATYKGVSKTMIRAKWVEFIGRSADAERIMYYAGIPDWKAFKGRNYTGRRFAKSWEEEDPSTLMALVHSRPLPVPRKPAATVSMKVISG